MKRHYKNLEVWERSIDLADLVYQQVKSFPKDETYGLISQIRRSILSVPSNIAEGATRQSKKEFLQFLSIASGSLAECNTQLILAQRACYLTQEQLNRLTIEIDVVGKMLNALRNSLKET